MSRAFRLTSLCVCAYTGWVNTGDVTAVVRSYAKVNLTLDVLGKRRDGYHAIESVMQSVSLCDMLTLRVGGPPGIRLSSDAGDMPVGEANLAYRAAVLLFERRRIAAGLGIRIEKRIPLESGLGGGSSNAAAVLKGLDRLLGLDMAAGELHSLAAELGSDVPFFIVGGTAFVKGRGEDVEALPDIRTWWLVVVKPPFGVSTEWAYRRLDEMRAEEPPLESGRMPVCTGDVPRGPRTHAVLECVRLEGCGRLPGLLWNNLEPPALERHPEIAEVKRAVVSAGARSALMCGSGSAAFGLFETEGEAAEAARGLGHLGKIFVAKTLTRAEAEEIVLRSGGN